MELKEFLNMVLFGFLIRFIKTSDGYETKVTYVLSRSRSNCCHLL